jgi:2-oxoisovalerate dehydrogenase E1 component beta subunit
VIGNAGVAWGRLRDGGPARRLVDGSDDRSHGLAHFGDGASAQGDVNEAFVFAASYNAPVVFFCQNNQWAISSRSTARARIPLYRARGSASASRACRSTATTSSRRHGRHRGTALERARAGEGPTFIEAFTYRMGAHTTSDDPTRYRISDDVEKWRLRDPIERLKVYLKRNRASPIRSSSTTSSARRTSSAVEGAAAGPRSAKADQASRATGDVRPRLRRAAPRLHRGAAAEPIADYDRRSGTEVHAMTTMTMAKGLNAGLRRAMEADDQGLLMGEDIGKLGGVFRITDGLQKDFGEHRVIDSPLAESGIVGTAVGMAHARLPTRSSRSSSTASSTRRSTRSCARWRRYMRYRSQGKVKMPIVIRIPFGGGIGAVEHHSSRRRRYFAHTPGLKVVACSNPVDGYWMIQQAIAHDDPVIFLEPKRQYHADKAELDDSGSLADAYPLFKSRLLRQGADLTLLAYGPMVKTAMKAAEAAASEGRALEVIDLRTLSPLDLAPVYESVRRTGRCVVAHEAHVNLGMGAEIAARVTEECFYSLEAPVLRVGAFDTPYPPSRIEEEYLPDLDRVLDAVDRTFEY